MLNFAKIVFGMELDGESWSSETSVNRYVCGPLGLLKYIENQVGRTGKEVGEAERVAAYQAKIAAAQKVGVELWCARSFEADAWSTAKQMLQWRDQIKELKRDLALPKGVSRRFDDVAAIEAAGEPLPEGVIDRAVALLAVGKKIAREVSLVCRLEDLPRLWRDLLTVYFDKVIESKAAQAQPKITIVRAHDEVALARDFARWIAAGKGANGDVALIVDGDSSLLDNELRALGQPVVGNAASSASRKTLQILPGKLMSFWEGKKIETPIDGVTVKNLIDAADSELEKAIDRDVLAKVARSHVKTMRELANGISEFKRSQLLRMLDTVIGDGCARPGVWNEVGCPRVVKSPEALATQSGKDGCATKYTLWWDFTDRKSAPMMRFADAEAESIGVDRIKEDVEALRRRELSGWRQAVTNTQREIVFFAPYSKEGENAALHPFYDYLARDIKVNSTGKDEIGKHIVDSSELQNGSGWRLADRQIVDLVPVNALRIKFEDEVKLDPVEKAPVTVSQSQMELMISCPFAWYHKNYLGLELGDATEVESEGLRKGNHAHKLVENLVRRGVKDVAGVEQHFDTLFREGLQKELPELLEPEAAAKYEEYRKSLKDSVVYLWNYIVENQLTIVGSEKELISEEDFCGSKLHGFADLLLKDKQGRDVIFDFKWSRGQKRFEEMIKEGKSIQFAVYHHLLGGNAKCYYYLFPLKKFIEDTQDNEAVFNNVKESYRVRLEEVMGEGVLKKAIITGLDGGGKDEQEKRRKEVEAAGLKIDLPAKCVFCEFNELCGRERKIKEAHK